MLPATLAILSDTFRGRERASAFAAWGATAGVAAASGPVVGGFLTTNYSWRWSFRINVIIAPLAIIGALALHAARRAQSPGAPRIDVPGALLIAVGMFLLVFALSEGGTYGWLDAAEGLHGRRPHALAASSAPVSMIPVVIALSARDPRRRSTSSSGPRSGATPIRCSSSRTSSSPRTGTGCSPGSCSRWASSASASCCPCSCKTGKHLTAAQNGLWLLPTGLFVIFGAQLGGRLDPRARTPRSSCGSASFLYALGIAYIALDDLARRHRVAAAAWARALRNRHRLRGRAARERCAFARFRSRRRASRQRREHDRAPGRRWRSASRSSARSSPRRPPGTRSAA